MKRSLPRRPIATRAIRKRLQSRKEPRHTWGIARAARAPTIRLPPHATWMIPPTQMSPTSAVASAMKRSLPRRPIATRAIRKRLQSRKEPMTSWSFARDVIRWRPISWHQRRYHPLCSGACSKALNAASASCDESNLEEAPPTESAMKDTADLYLDYCSDVLGLLMLTTSTPIPS